METELLEMSKAVKIIGSKWTLLILNSLLKGRKRFGQIQKEVENVNPRTLSKRLHDLEKQGFIHKKIYPEVPPRVEYSLTKKAEIFKQVIKATKACGEGM